MLTAKERIKLRDQSETEFRVEQLHKISLELDAMIMAAAKLSKDLDKGKTKNIYKDMVKIRESVDRMSAKTERYMGVVDMMQHYGNNLKSVGVENVH